MVYHIQKVASTQVKNIPFVFTAFLNVVIKIESIPVCTFKELIYKNKEKGGGGCKRTILKNEPTRKIIRKTKR